MSAATRWPVQCPGCGRPLGALPGDLDESGDTTVVGSMDQAAIHTLDHVVADAVEHAVANAVDHAVADAVDHEVADAADDLLTVTVATSADAMSCPCGRTFALRDGVWDFLLPERADHFDPFLDEYTAVRRAEGRTGRSLDELKALPDAPRSDPLAWQWRIRKASARCLMETVLPAVVQATGRIALRVLDLGAGVGWLSHRLAQAGCDPMAVDISVDPEDGLGAARRLALALSVARPFPVVRAEFDRLPVPDGAVDLVVYNASLHYSSHYEVTLAEGLRVLAPGGALVVMDSPIYRSEASGVQMVLERKSQYTKRFGFPSDRLGSREYLTEGDLAALGTALDVEWQRFEPWYGWRWALRPWRARRSGQREPSRFQVLVGRRRQPS